MQPKIISFDLLRIIAAIIVINFHYGKTIFGLQHFYSTGQQMVTLFFVLSGFVIYISSANKTKIDFLNFFQKRLFKIIPLSLFGLFVMILLFYLDGRIIDYTSVIWHIFFLHSLMPKYTLAFNYPDWYISTQIILYLFALPIFFAVKKFSIKSTFVVVMFFWFATQIFLTFITENTLGFDSITLRGLIFYFPTSHLSSFGLGMVAAKYFLEKKEAKNNLWPTITVSLFFVISLEYYKVIGEISGFNIPFGASFFAPICALLIFVFAKYANFEIFSNPNIKLLGDSSFAIYILHAPIHFALLNFFDLNTKSIYHYFYYLTITVLIGILAHKYIELNGSKLLEKIFSKF